MIGFMQLNCTFAQLKLFLMMMVIKSIILILWGLCAMRIAPWSNTQNKCCCWSFEKYEVRRSILCVCRKRERETAKSGKKLKELENRHGPMLYKAICRLFSTPYKHVECVGICIYANRHMPFNWSRRNFIVIFRLSNVTHNISLFVRREPVFVF